MFHGGTNFGLTNGANDKGTYQPIVTSYDYDAPLDEAATRPRSTGRSARSSPGTRRCPTRRPARRRCAPSSTSQLDRDASLFDVVDGLGTSPRTTTCRPWMHSAATAGSRCYRPAIESRARRARRRRGARPGPVFLDGVAVGVLARDHRARARAARGRTRNLDDPRRGPGAGELRAADRGAKGLIGAAWLDGVRSGRGRVAGLESAASTRACRPPPGRDRPGPVVSPGTFELVEPDRPVPRHLGLGQGRRVGQRVLPRPLLARPQRRSTCPGRCFSRARTSSWSSSWMVPLEPVARFVGELGLGHTEL